MGPFSKNLPGSKPRFMYCRQNAGMIEIDPVVHVDSIMGESIPDDVLVSFVDDEDPSRGLTYSSVSSCPLRFVDSDSPHYSPEYLADIMAEARAIAAGVPDAWTIKNPSDALVEGVVLLRSEVEAAGNFKIGKNEKW